MNKYITRRFFIILDIILVITLIILIILIINSILTNDFISPSKISTIDYFRVKLSNII